MNQHATNPTQRVIKLVQELLLDVENRSDITPAAIGERIELVLSLNPRWREGLDVAAARDELIRRFSIWIGNDAKLIDDAGHVAWLSSDRKREWRYWRRYQEWLELKLSFEAIDALDRSTDSILGLLEDPVREGSWDRRGLVVGHVQSGKTSSYTGLICKAADAGYKIIIVLAGLHKNLRSQTQMRLDEGFLGFETNPVATDIRIIGVGEIDSDPAIRPNYATNRSDNGDFSTRIARNLGITPEQRPWLFVVKKNKSVLERLHRWIIDHVADTSILGEDRRIVGQLPLLLIDDEADHASVDTGERVIDVNGEPDFDHQPTAINRCIRRILHAFGRSAYVGYTATPFANIFIHERGETRSEGPDLFPSSFIVSLAAASNYVGPARVFGLQTGEERREGMPVIREIDDYSNPGDQTGWMPQRHRNGHIPLHDGRDTLPPSLVEAVDAFVLACAVRSLRGQGREHCSMLVHVTRYTSVQTEVHRQVEEHLRRMRQRLTRGVDEGELLARLANHWERDFVPTHRTLCRQVDSLVAGQVEAWADVRGALPDVVQDIETVMINGTARDALNYVDHVGTGLKVIAIGGDKLARGLTLEGLCVSYFLRASRMYDTLMQMGRWFGYRPGYLDVCRLYTTAELSTWFGHIADAAEELREEFDLMAASGATPRDYGLKVQSHPVLMVTSRLKMRTARSLRLSFSGELVETVSLFRDPAVLQGNVDAVRGLIAGLGSPEVDPVRNRGGGRHRWKGFLWSDVPAAEVTAFLLACRTHPDAYKVNSALLAEFVNGMTAAGELTNWTVALLGGGEGGSFRARDGVTVDMMKRKEKTSSGNGYSIGRLLSGRDEAIDLDETAWQAALALTREASRRDPGRGESNTEPVAPNGPAIRMVRGFGAEGVPARPDTGLLLLYVLDPAESGAEFAAGTPPVAAFGISFPGSTAGVKVEYKVNNVLWEQEYGPAD